jgi:glutamyl-tRNA synthetase
MPRTRLAPSPTGALHLGNARTFLVNWALARQRGWDVVLRIEDLDGPRVKPEAAAEAIDVLGWLGLDWDEGPYYQRDDVEPYRAALDRLRDQGIIYPCVCTRREIEEAALSAPHGDAHELRYTGRCRPQQIKYPPDEIDAMRAGGGIAAHGRIVDRDQYPWRIIVPAGSTEFRDSFRGDHTHDVQATIGDFLVATQVYYPSYQLAVVIDDARQEIDRVVRGDDLLASTHRQRLLQERLGLTPPAEYYHLPLVVGPDGRRLAKRHGDSRITHYRAAGVPAERIIGLLAEWSGLGPRREMSAAEFAREFLLERLPREKITFSPVDDVWLVDRRQT